MIKKISIIALALLLIGFIGSLFTFKSIFAAKEPTEKIVTIQKGFDAIEIDSDGARVEVQPANITEARVELTGAFSNDKLDAAVEKSTLKIEVGNKRKKLFSFDFTAALLTLKVLVPEKEYEALQIESSNGRVQLTGITAKDILTRTDNGNISMQDVKTSTITAGAGNGRIELNGVSADKVSIWAANGQVRLDDVTGIVNAETNNGSIALHTDTLDRDIDFATDNGKITIETAKKPTNAVLDIKTVNGRIEVFGSRDWETVIGAGENVVKLTAKNGRITVK
jgi:DUF4097 and DUF4098 domain-containing protein YvlB